MAIDTDALTNEMFNAAFGVLKGRAPSISTYVRGECAKIAQTFATIQSGVRAGEISAEEAIVLLDMQKSAARTVLLSAEGLGMLAVEQAINTALDEVKSVVNAALGFALI